jgi:hypothetical protein
MILSVSGDACTINWFVRDVPHRGFDYGRVLLRALVRAHAGRRRRPVRGSRAWSR